MKLNEDIDTPGMCSQYLARFSDIKIMKNPKAIGMAIINSIVIVGGFNFFVSVFFFFILFHSPSVIQKIIMSSSKLVFI